MCPGVARYASASATVSVFVCTGRVRVTHPYAQRDVPRDADTAFQCAAKRQNSDVHANVLKYNKISHCRNEPIP